MKLYERISWLKTTLQENLFPHLRECFDDPLTEKQKDLIMILEVVEIEKYVAHLNGSWTGRPPNDRCPLARAFVAKAVYNVENTRMLIDLLHAMPLLRKICGFVRRNDIPSESTFSRAVNTGPLCPLFSGIKCPLFADHFSSQYPRHHQVDAHLSGELIGHVARDATAIEGNEKPCKKDRKEHAPKKRGRPKKGEAREHRATKRLVMQVNQSPREALKEEMVKIFHTVTLNTVAMSCSCWFSM